MRRRRRVGVIQPGARATSHARSPVAAAPADIAPIMHCTHMPGPYARLTGVRMAGASARGSEGLPRNALAQR